MGVTTLIKHKSTRLSPNMGHRGPKTQSMRTGSLGIMKKVVHYMQEQGKFVLCLSSVFAWVSLYVSGTLLFAGGRYPDSSPISI